MKGDTTENDLKEKLAEFLGGKMWMIIGVSSIFVSFSCIGALLICKKWYALSISLSLSLSL